MNRSASVLLVDDDPGIRETLSDVLRLKGYVVETAATGEEGIEKSRARPFDVAVLDIKLPDISGLDLLKALRTVARDTEIVLITGYASLATAIQAINGAAFAYVVKPFEIDHLLAILGKAIEKREVSLALLESEERYRLISENITDAIFLVDLEGRLLYTNRRGEEMIGYRMEEFQGRPVLSLLTSEGVRQARARLEAARAGSQALPSFEAEVTRKDGSRIWVEANITGLVRSGRVEGILGVARDISERKQLQENLIQAEKLATLGELIAGIAHELNNPLSVMMGHAELLRMGQSDPKVAARAERLVEAAQRATRVVRNFLTFARRHKPEKVVVSINDIITRTLEFLDYQFRVGNVGVQTELAPGLPPISGDPHQLQQVVLNLVNNACHAMAKAGKRGTLRVTTALAADRTTVRITVADDGPGILSEHLPRLFEPFFTTKPPGEGTGLGLPIAQGIAAEHGGTITVQSAPGRGATFVVTLPGSANPPVEPGAPEPLHTPTGLRVLVVDDESALREFLADALVEAGNRVETAASGEEALSILDRSPVDVLVLDVRMPGMSGTDLWTRIARSNPTLARRAVFCSGDVVGDQTQAFLESTGCLSVNKPCELSGFLDAVGRAASR